LLFFLLAQGVYFPKHCSSLLSRNDKDSFTEQQTIKVIRGMQQRLQALPASPAAIYQ